MKVTPASESGITRRREQAAIRGAAVGVAGFAAVGIMASLILNPRPEAEIAYSRLYGDSGCLAETNYGTLQSPLMATSKKNVVTIRPRPDSDTRQLPDLRLVFHELSNDDAYFVPADQASRQQLAKHDCDFQD